MGFAVDPTWTTEANRLGCFEGVFRSAIAADWVVAISEASRLHYLRTFPHFPEERIRVIYPCSRFADSSAQGVRPKALEGQPSAGFWLNVGTVEPRKNQRRLVEAYARYLAAGGTPMPLVLAGGKGWLMEDFQKHLHDLGVQAHVIMTGYVSDEELIWLYRNCYANLYPSLFEGFGLPVLEGMQFGAPTVTTRRAPFPRLLATRQFCLIRWTWMAGRMRCFESPRIGLSAMRSRLTQSSKRRSLTGNTVRPTYCAYTKRPLPHQNDAWVHEESIDYRHHRSGRFIPRRVSARTGI
jgi:hypothetical protein